MTYSTCTLHHDLLQDPKKFSIKEMMVTWQSFVHEVWLAAQGRSGASCQMVPAASQLPVFFLGCSTLTLLPCGLRSCGSTLQIAGLMMEDPNHFSASQDVCERIANWCMSVCIHAPNIILKAAVRALGARSAAGAHGRRSFPAGWVCSCAGAWL